MKGPKLWAVYCPECVSELEPPEEEHTFGWVLTLDIVMTPYATDTTPTVNYCSKHGVKETYQRVLYSDESAGSLLS